MADPWELAKKAAARKAVEEVRAGQRIALGTGSTAAWVVREIAGRFPDGGGVECVASSRATERLARSLGLTVRELQSADRFDLMIDGADEATPSLNLLKGGGGALFREKLLAQLSRRRVIVVDASKIVRHLGESHPIPVEVVPFARPVLLPAFERRRFRAVLRRTASGEPFITDNGNEIVDLTPPGPIGDARALAEELRSETGVVETGIFCGLADRIVVGQANGETDEFVRPEG